jgi:hypothetical protein
MDGGQVISRIRTVAGSTKALLALSAVMIPLAILSAASPGHADDVPPATRFAVGSPAMAVAQQIAQANWGMDACGGQVAIEWGTDDANINARSFWANPVSSYDNADLNTQCRIVFNATMTFSWPKFCTVLVHEYGHLTGHPHTTDGPDVMSPIYRAPLPACTTADPSAPPAPATVTTTTAPPPSTVVVDAPAVKRPTSRRARTHAGAKAAKARSHEKTRARAHLAAAPLQHFSDADAEFALPWAPFADTE